VVRIKSRILSPTAINTYIACPRKFYLRYIKRLRSKPSIYLIRGSIVHKVIHDFHLNFEKGDPKASLGRIEKALIDSFMMKWEQARASIDSLGLPEQWIQCHFFDTIAMLKNFAWWYRENGEPKITSSEIRLVSESLNIMGIIDAVYDSREGAILVDYKTSKKIEITPDITRQGALYALLYKELYGKEPAVIRIHFLASRDEPAAIFVDDHLLNYAQLLIDTVFEKTQSMKEDDYPCTCGGYCERDFITS